MTELEEAISEANRTEEEAIRKSTLEMEKLNAPTAEESARSKAYIDENTIEAEKRRIIEKRYSSPERIIATGEARLDRILGQKNNIIEWLNGIYRKRKEKYGRDSIDIYRVHDTPQSRWSKLKVGEEHFVKSYTLELFSWEEDKEGSAFGDPMGRSYNIMYQGKEANEKNLIKSLNQTDWTAEARNLKYDHDKPFHSGMDGLIEHIQKVFLPHIMQTQWEDSIGWLGNELLKFDKLRKSLQGIDQGDIDIQVVLNQDRYSGNPEIMEGKDPLQEAMVYIKLPDGNEYRFTNFDNPIEKIDLFPFDPSTGSEFIRLSPQPGNFHYKPPFRLSPG